jgi:hypothetical protein
MWNITAKERKMNKERRSALSEGLMNLENSIELFDVLKERVARELSVIEDSLNDEQDYFDNMPESIQNSEKGEMAQEAIDKLQEAVDLVNEFLETEVNYQEIDDLVCQAMG